MAADLLARVRAEIDARLAELRPAVAEYERLLGAAGALDADADAAGTGASASRRQAPPSAAERPPATSPRAKPARATPARRGGRRGSAAGALERAASAPRGAAQQAIVAALEHGSHTVSELVLVTAMSGGEIREGLRRLQRAGAVTRTKREGRAAYALPSPTA